MAHIYNLSYMGGNRQEDHSLKPAQAKAGKTPSLKQNTGWAQWFMTNLSYTGSWR
jgi:hypothetical protein